MRIFGRKRKSNELRIELSGGLFLGRPGDMQRQNSLISCLPKGILCFLVVFGSLGGFISAFDIDCNYVIPAVILFLTAMYFSGLFAFRRSWHKDVGYILYFIFYVMAIVTLKSYVNSGFAAIINGVKQGGEVYFGLNTGTEFAERIDDRFLTVTITFIFIGIFEIILLNIFLSNYMSLKLAVFMGLSLYAVPLYLRREPDLFFALCMLCGFIGIYIFKNSGHFRDGNSRLGYERTERRAAVEVAYTQNNKVYAGVLLSALCCTLLVGVCTVFFDEEDFRRRYSQNEIKAAGEDAVAGFLMLGFRSFYRNAYSHGGMSGGRLGDIAAIRPDNETDLVVRFAPYSSSPIYLKAYTGIIYDHNEWTDYYKWTGAPRWKSEYFYIESMANEANQLARAYEKGAEGQGRAVIEVENKGADDKYVYYPYFTLFDDYSKYTDSKTQYVAGSGIGETNRFTCYPNIGYAADVEGKVPEHCDEVSFENLDSVNRFINAAGVHAGDEDVVEKVVAYMKEEYSYSYNPGRLPAGEDVVNYFLDENKKGVCYHFASAATLIFRRLGIPARYVEGYAFGYNTIAGGKVREDLKYGDYYSGYSELGETAVMEVNVTDANAHAWVEIFEEGKGWVVVDPTPTVIDEEGGDNFWSSLSDFWQNAPDLELAGDLSGLNLGFLNSNGMRLALTILFGAVMFTVLLCLFIRQLRRWHSWHTGDLRCDLLWYYRDVCVKWGRRDASFGKLSVPSEQIAYLGQAYGTGDRRGESFDWERVAHCMEEICFCPSEPRREDYEYVLRALKKIKRRRRSL